jgi:hypothetical protein
MMFAAASMFLFLKAAGRGEAPRITVAPLSTSIQAHASCADSPSGRAEGGSPDHPVSYLSALSMDAGLSNVLSTGNLCAFRLIFFIASAAGSKPSRSNSMSV